MDIVKEIEERTAYIRRMLEKTGAKGLVFGNSGGKDSALVGILCRRACENTTGIMMPCESKRNYSEDLADAGDLAEKFGINTVTVDITDVKRAMISAFGDAGITLGADASSNINPRLRMSVLYAYARENGCLVAGTGNACERFVGYFTKWGDGACDFNPIGDLSVSEIYELLEYLGAPENIIKKAPSAALIEGQTDEGDMGVTYDEITAYMQNGAGAVSGNAARIIGRMHSAASHKLSMPPVYPQEK
ncbi:MAG: NAD(+) synthase [Eubacteriaceae bacterium]|nr:NAD(+) synthase [Eubacteriaceae bacterium]